jgi:hypothetical protein
MSAEEWTHQADVTPDDEVAAAAGEAGPVAEAAPATAPASATPDGDEPTTAVAGSTLAATEAEA